MLSLINGNASRDCQGMDRRDFLNAGTLALGGLSLPWLLQQKAEAAEGGFVREKSVVMLFLSGGASQVETFNPNMDAPAPYHSMTGEVKTKVPGMRLGGTFPQLAEHAEKLAFVHSFQHPVGGHVQAIAHVLNGGENSPEASMGSMVSRLRGTNHPVTGMPTYTLLTSKEVDPQYRSERGRVQRGSAPGKLGGAYGPFAPNGEGPAVENMRLNMPTARFDDRRALLSSLDGLKRQAEAGGGLGAVDGFQQQAFDFLLGNVFKVFDLSKEDPRWRRRYDTSSMKVGKKKFRPSQLGEHMLKARRLIEAGCRFVTVHSAGWDMHADSNNPGIEKGMEMLGRPVDKAVSAFLEDLEERGMVDDVLLVIAGDFGRTPRINDRGGRDHWPRLCPLAFAGGGLKTGQIIGRSGRRNDEPESEPVSTGNLMATVMHTLFDIGELRVARGIPTGIRNLIEERQPIEGLL